MQVGRGCVTEAGSVDESSDMVSLWAQMRRVLYGILSLLLFLFLIEMSKILLILHSFSKIIRVINYITYPYADDGSGREEMTE